MRSGMMSSPARKPRRRGERWIVLVPHEGHTSGSCARSAAMSANASGARYSLIPRLPTATPLRSEIYTTQILTHFSPELSLGEQERSMHTQRARPRSATAGVAATPRPGFEPIATVAIDAVTPSDRGLTLTGQGADRAAYPLDGHFDLPLDPRTPTALTGLLSQSALTTYRAGVRHA